MALYICDYRRVYPFMSYYCSFHYYPYSYPISLNHIKTTFTNHLVCWFSAIVFNSKPPISPYFTMLMGGIPSGKQPHNYGTSPWKAGKTHYFNDHFLCRFFYVYQAGYNIHFPMGFPMVFPLKPPFSYGITITSHFSLAGAAGLAAPCRRLLRPRPGRSAGVWRPPRNAPGAVSITCSFNI